MQQILQGNKKYSSILIKLLPIIAFAVPLMWLYFLDAASFELMWKGRTFQLFFIWLICIELILGWENLQVNKIKKLQSIRTIGFIATLTLPTIYVVASFYWGLNNAITDLATQSRIQWASSMPLSTEYLIFTILFCLMVYLSFGFKGLKYYSVPAFFAAIVGCLYTVDNIFPYGQFTPFQIFVPTTTALAAAILNFIGYPTSITFGQNSLAGNMPFLTAVNPNIIGNPSTTFAIAWPCAGIESFLLFTVVALLFIKRINFSFKAKIGYFVFGAVVTYLINVLRVVNIFLIGMSQGANSLEVDLFHFYYGPLYAVTWIIAYPLIIILSQNLWHRIKKANQPKTTETRPF